MTDLLLLQGPNLNLLGTREPDIYGAVTLADIHHRLQQQAIPMGHQLTCLQSNAEHDLINAIHRAKADNVAFIIINPGAYTHTSIALRDALLGVAIPFIEIHLSNIHARESFRHHSYLADIAIGTVCGFGTFGYEMALMAADHYLRTHKNQD